VQRDDHALLGGGPMGALGINRRSGTKLVDLTSLILLIEQGRLALRWSLTRTSN
jgi:hypothetical protein